MKLHDPNFNWQPSPEQLTAYVDGELDEVSHARVEAWLADHSDAAAEVTNDRRLLEAFRANSASAPGEPEWSRTWSGIEVGMAAPRPSKVQTKGNGLRWVIAGTAAAAVLLAVFLGWPTPRQDGHDVSEHHPVEAPFEVASAEDVHIETVHADDVHAIVVGELPVAESLTVAAAEDVTVHGIEPNANARWFDPAATMIVVPLIEEAPKEEG